MYHKLVFMFIVCESFGYGGLSSVRKCFFVMKINKTRLIFCAGIQAYIFYQLFNIIVLYKERA